MRKKALILLAALLFTLAPPAQAQGNPFSPGSRPQTEQAKPPASPQAAAPAPAAPADSWSNWFAGIQRQVNRQLNQRLAEINKGSPTALLLGAALAFAYGVFHAAGPGHGKMLVVSYFIGRDARPWRGALMGGQVALVHVGGAIIVALIALAVMAGAAPPSPEDMRGVKLTSYAAVAAIGAWLFVSVLRGGGHLHAHHDHGHGHDHAHDHGHAHAKGQGLSAAMVSLAAGAVPCTGAVLVLIYCIANGIPLMGLLLVLLIGLGMAVTLTGFGLFGMLARRQALALAARGEKPGRPARWRRALDLAGPGLILGLGVALFIGAY
jgi:ABC-type nickel/cobalt efflux system permease component RcnA